MQNFTPQQVVHFTKQYESGEFPTERFGQAFMNHVATEATDSELFHAPRSRAEELIWTRYLKEETTDG